MRLRAVEINSRFCRLAEQSANGRDTSAGADERAAGNIVGEQSGLAQRRVLRRRHEGATEEMSGRFHTSADQPVGVNQAEQRVSYQVPCQHHEVRRSERQGDQSGDH